MTLEEVLKAAGFENVPGAKEGKIPFNYLNSFKIQQLFQYMDLGDGIVVRPLSFPDSATVRVLVNDPVESVADSSKTGSSSANTMYSEINFNKGWIELNALLYAYGRMNVKNLEDLTQIKTRYSRITDFIGRLKYINKYFPSIGRDLRNLLFDLDKVQEDFPQYTDDEGHSGLGEIWKAHFFENTKYNSIHVCDESGNIFNLEEILYERLFKGNSYYEQKQLKYFKWISDYERRSTNSLSIKYNNKVLQKYSELIQFLDEMHKFTGESNKNSVILKAIKNPLNTISKFLNQKLGFSLSPEFISEHHLSHIFKLINYENTKGQAQLHEMELIHQIWLYCVSKFSSMDDYHSDIENILSMKTQATKIRDEYFAHSEEGWEHYVPPTTLDTAKLIIGAKKSSLSASYIQYGKPFLKGQDSKPEVFITSDMLTVRLPDGTEKYAMVATYEDGVRLPFSLFEPQYTIYGLWDPTINQFVTFTDSVSAAEDQIKENPNGLIWQRVDWLTVSNSIRIVEEGNNRKIVFVQPEFLFFSYDGGSKQDYYNSLCERSGINLLNELTTIHIHTNPTAFSEGFKNFFNNKENLPEWIEYNPNAKYNDDDSISNYFISITPKQEPLFFRMRNDPQNIGLSVREVIIKGAEWLRQERIAHRYKTLYYGFEQRNLGDLLKRFGVIGEYKSYWIPTLDADGNIQFDEIKKKILEKIETPDLDPAVAPFQKNRQKVYRTYLANYENIRAYYIEEFKALYGFSDADDLVNILEYRIFMQEFEAFISKLRAFVEAS
ncbi:MAG: hypothetical protein K9W44_13195 [Candidatus Lokiarchaeota archaeon]|nr:hypothetical protein [Candidatus Harpocratesius repetitus]